MKKLLLTMSAVCCAWCGMQAQNDIKKYTDDLIVTVNGTSTAPAPTTIITEDLGNGGINLELQDFILRSEGDEIPIGNIHVADIPLKEENGYQSFDLKDKMTVVTAGDESTGIVWMGPIMFPDGLSIDISGKSTDEKFYCTLDLTFAGEVIHVTFGTDEFGNSVHSVNADGAANRKVDVYTLQGSLIRRGVEKAHALNGLQKGIYIVGGRKTVKK